MMNLIRNLGNEQSKEEILKHISELKLRAYKCPQTYEVAQKWIKILEKKLKVYYNTKGGRKCTKNLK